MFAYCPRCASKNIEFTDGKKHVCADCAFTLYHNTAAAVAVLVKSGDNYLILKRGKDPGKGLYDLPGGFVDPGESAEECCRREIREEMGISIKNLTYCGSGHNIYPYKDVTYNTCDLFFTADSEDKNYLRQEEEIEEIILLKKDEIDIDRFAFESIKDFIRRTFN